ncbi:MAG: heparinase II/III family protein [Spirochaetes bacterium]|nr:heparinase II/III family protein [Spirochaetota bacterium]
MSTQESWGQSLPDFPKPAPEKAFAELKLVQPDGGVYRRPVEDWKSARQYVATNAAGKKWLNEQCAAIDAWMTRPRDRVEWKCGRNSAFVSPVDGSFLVWTEKIPGEEVKTFTSRTGHEVEITEKTFGGWVFKLREKHFGNILTAARLFRLTGDKKYADWAAEQLDFYADNYQRFPVVKVDNYNYARISGHSLNDAMYLSKIAETARLLFDWAGVERRQGWYRNFFKPEVELLDRSYQTIHNIAIWQRASSAQVALLYGDEEMWEREMNGQFGLRAQFSRGVTSDYFWAEQSIQYNNFCVYAVLPLLNFAGLVGKQDRIATEAALVQNMVLAPVMIRFPDGSLPNPGDATGVPYVKLGLFGDCARILPTTIGVLAQDALNWDTLVDPIRTEGGTTNLPDVVSRNMESARFALLKKGPWQVFFHYGQLSQSHSQSEALSWSASFDGIDISHDCGTVGYASPLHKYYYTRGLNHNVPLINGEGQAVWNPGKLISFDAAASVMSAEQPAYRTDASARRTMRIEGETLIDEVAVTYTGSGDARLGLALNLYGTPALPENFKPDSTFAEGRPKSFSYWKDVRSAGFKDRTEFEVTFKSNRNIAVAIIVPGPFTVYQGSAPDRPPQRKNSIYIETRGQKAVFVTRLTPVRR